MHGTLRTHIIIFADVLGRCTSMVTNVSLEVKCFSFIFRITKSFPYDPVGPWQINLVFCFSRACGRFRDCLLYVTNNCLLACLGYIILCARGGGYFLWIPVVDFSHQEVNRVVVCEQGLLYTIVSAACEFLYLNM